MLPIGEPCDMDFLKTEEISLRYITLDPDDPQRKWDPAVHFDILDHTGARAGGCNLRLGHSEALYYAGNIGYQIDEPWRGHHYAGKTCRLLFELARRQGMEYVIITCAPENQPSRRTCEWLGGELVEIVELPEDDQRRQLTGSAYRCIFRFFLTRGDTDMFLDTDFLKNDEIQLILEKTVEADPGKNWLPAYHFAICDLSGAKMGTCDLRIGHNESVYYGGNIGYRIDEPWRGHDYAGKACRLLFELARRHGMDYVIITCNPDNRPSRRTCEWLGGELVEIVELPEDNSMRVEDGETHKYIYRFGLKTERNECAEGRS